MERYLPSFSAPRPWVYLDHWALRLFSAELIRGERMARVLRRGTLMLSTMNLLEIARTRSPRTMRQFQEFLDAIGTHWAFIHRVHMVAEKEVNRVALPWLDVGWSTATRMKYGATLGKFIAKLHEPWAEKVLGYWENEIAEISEHFEIARSRVRRKTLVLDPVHVAGSYTRTVYKFLLQRLTSSDLKLDRNQFDDLIHAVPVAYADVVFLDKRFAMLVERHPAGRKVFTRARVDDALEYLEGGWRRSDARDP